MWSSTRNDMPNDHWVPNHFVAVLPIENNNPGNVAMQREKLKEMRKVENEAGYLEKRHISQHQIAIKYKRHI